MWLCSNKHEYMLQLNQDNIDILNRRHTNKFKPSLCGVVVVGLHVIGQDPL